MSMDMSYLLFMSLKNTSSVKALPSHAVCSKIFAMPAGDMTQSELSFCVLPTCKTAIICRTLDLLRFLRDNNPESQVILMSILPRGWDTDSRRAVWPNPYTASISSVNAALAHMSSQDSFVHFFNCTSLLLIGGQVILGSILRCL